MHRAHSERIKKIVVISISKYGLGKFIGKAVRWNAYCTCSRNTLIVYNFICKLIFFLPSNEESERHFYGMLCALLHSVVAKRFFWNMLCLLSLPSDRGRYGFVGFKLWKFMLCRAKSMSKIECNHFKWALIKKTQIKWSNPSPLFIDANIWLGLLDWHLAYKLPFLQQTKNYFSNNTVIDVSLSLCFFLNLTKYINFNGPFWKFKNINCVARGTKRTLPQVK